MENTSGQGAQATVPGEIDHWNWGAFFLGWIWGIGNNTFIALLMFVPFVNLVMPFILGAKGSAWAWKNKKWESIDHFKSVQRQWAKWGAIVFVACVTFIVLLFFAITMLLKNNGAYQLAITKLGTNQEIARIVGQPISTGTPTGSVEVSGQDGTAQVSFSISGPKGNGIIYLEATKNLGQWHIDNMVLEQETGERTDVNK